VDDAGKIIGSEDCLTVNVWTPAKRSSPLPVLFFIHGGNNQIGSSSDPSTQDHFFDGAYWAAHGPAVVVTINYRLGPFGFLGAPEFSSESPNHSTGNYALLDQIFALEWVHDNIAQFGGDPSHVMVFGHSAGSVNASALLASPLARGLFSAVGLQSGPSVGLSKETVNLTAMAAKKALGCAEAADVPACLRAKTAEDIAKVPGAVLGAADPEGAQFNPSVDGFVLKDRPRNVIAKGEHNHVPVLLGTTKNEYGELIDLMVPQPVTNEASYGETVEKLVGKVVKDRVLLRYPLADYATPRDALAMMVGDLFMTCPTRRLARSLSAGQDEPVFRYVYTHVFDGPRKAAGAAHGFEIGFVFHHFVGHTPTQGELELSDAINGYWTRLSKTGNVNGDGAFSWPAYSAGADSMLALDLPFQAVEGVRSEQCDFWDTIDDS
jgi:para-nitrobenzyl esterase